MYIQSRQEMEILTKMRKGQGEGIALKEKKQSFNGNIGILLTSQRIYLIFSILS